MKLHWGTGIAVVYALFAAATLGFAAFAMGQEVDLVSPDYYQRALRHDARMAASANALALGDALRVHADEDGRGVGVTWMDARPEPGEGTITLYRASNAGSDRTVAIDPDAGGRQRISLADLTPGVWKVQIHWRAGGREYYAERRVFAR
jgi:nitrogen fixation protein FixH